MPLNYGRLGFSGIRRLIDLLEAEPGDRITIDKKDFLALLVCHDRLENLFMVAEGEFPNVATHDPRRRWVMDDAINEGAAALLNRQGPVSAEDRHQVAQDLREDAAAYAAGPRLVWNIT